VVVAVDANGADLGPAEVAAGAGLASAAGVKVLLFGPAAELPEPPPGVELVDAPVSIAKHDDPARAVRTTPEASIVQAARAVADGRAQALVCAGGTGAALAAGLFNVKRAPGIYRPALALPLPVPGRGGAPVTLIDVGANVETRPEHLVQFAFMGGAFAQAVLGLARPRVALLSNGAEAQRGGPLLSAARAELELALATAGTGATIELVANVEGNNLLDGAVDVVVTDGFTGNVALKLIEGVSSTTLASIREAAMASPRARLGGLLLRPALRAFRDAVDPEAQGGAYLLGLRALAVVPHGRFRRGGFARAIVRAGDGVTEDVASRTQAQLERAGVLRRVPSASRFERSGAGAR
jgi:glycerol-3-phosphate acyltransferase PlsX